MDLGLVGLLIIVGAVLLWLVGHELLVHLEEQEDDREGQ